MNLRSFPVIGTLMFFFFYGFGQSFEGVMTMHVSSSPLNLTTVTVKGHKSVTEYQIDTTENIKIIKDAAAETQTILRHKGDMKYGYATLISEEETIPEITIEDLNKVSCEGTIETKMIGSYKCFKSVLHTDKAVAEAWVTKDIAFPLSKYFPIFLGDGTDPALLELRKRANSLGFVMEYKESLIGTGDETHIEMNVEQKDIPLEAFATHGFLVFNKDGLSQLFTDSYLDPNKKKQWEEFRQIFGKKD